MSVTTCKLQSGVNSHKMALLTRNTVSHIQNHELDLFQPKAEWVRHCPTCPACNSVRKNLNRDRELRTLTAWIFQLLSEHVCVLLKLSENCIGTLFSKKEGSYYVIPVVIPLKIQCVIQGKPRRKIWEKADHFHPLPLGDTRGMPGTPPPPRLGPMSFICMQFWGKFDRIIRHRPHFWGWPATPLSPSPYENAGSATDPLKLLILKLISNWGLNDRVPIDNCVFVVWMCSISVITMTTSLRWYQ